MPYLIIEVSCKEIKIDTNNSVSSYIRLFDRVRSISVCVFQCVFELLCCLSCLILQIQKGKVNTIFNHENLYYLQLALFHQNASTMPQNGRMFFLIIYVLANLYLEILYMDLFLLLFAGQQSTVVLLYLDVEFFLSIK